MAKKMNSATVRERKALAIVHAGAAGDSQFRSDNEAIETDFALLDRDAEAPTR